MKKLASYFLVLLLLVGVVPVDTVHAESQLSGKIFVSSAESTYVCMKTSDEYIIVAQSGDKYYYPISCGSDEITSIFYTDETKNYDWSRIDGVSTLDLLKSDVSKNASKYGKSSSTVDTSLQCDESFTNYIFFDKNGNYIDTVNKSDLGNFQYNTDSKEYKGTTDAKVVPIGDKYADVTLSYDFSNYPESLGGEYIESVVICEDGDKDLVIYDEDKTLDYLEDADETKGKLSAISMSSNGKYSFFIKTNANEYQQDFVVNNIASKGSSKKTTTSKKKVSKPKVTFSKLPSSVKDGTPTKITLYSSKKSIIVFNGESTRKYKTSSTITVEHNGNYSYTATSKDGGVTSGTLSVKFFKSPNSNSKVNMSYYYGDGTDKGTGTLPQTGKNGGIILFASTIAVIVGLCIFFRKKLKVFFSSILKGGMLHVKK